MIELPEPGLYRTTTACPGHEEALPAGVLVYVGQPKGGGPLFAVRPGRNENNRWFWGEPTVPLRSPTWGRTLKRLPAEGFYTLPDTLHLDGGGKWLKNAIVQLGYNGDGRGILFIAERRDAESANVLTFGDRGMVVEDAFLARLQWAPILPVARDEATPIN